VRARAISGLLPLFPAMLSTRFFPPSMHRVSSFKPVMLSSQVLYANNSITGSGVTAVHTPEVNKADAARFCHPL
jgi:hypothetical protein